MGVTASRALSLLQGGARRVRAINSCLLLGAVAHYPRPYTYIDAAVYTAMRQPRTRPLLARVRGRATDYRIPRN